MSEQGNQSNTTTYPPRVTNFFGFLRYYGAFFTHIGLIVMWYASPFFLDWRIVAGTVAFYYAQNRIHGGCILSTLQFSQKDEGFFAHYLRRIGLKVDHRTLKLLGHLIPQAILITAVFYQVILPRL